jgi:hypothetical protein
MTDIIANILARLAALEQAVGVAQPARTDDRPRRRLPTVAVAQRYNVVPRTIDRWAKAPELDFPAAEVINRRRYWDEDALDAWDQARIRSSVSNAAAARLRTSRKMPVLVPSDAASAGYGRDPTPSTTAQPSHPPDPGNERRHDMRNRQCSQRRRR